MHRGKTGKKHPKKPFVVISDPLRSWRASFLAVSSISQWACFIISIRHRFSDNYKNWDPGRTHSFLEIGRCEVKVAPQPSGSLPFLAWSHVRRKTSRRAESLCWAPGVHEQAWTSTLGKVHTLISGLSIPPYPVGLITMSGIERQAQKDKYLGNTPLCICL